MLRETRVNSKNQWEPELLNESYKDEGQRSLWEDYCMNSTIHGFKYFVGSKRTLIERVWWFVVCIMSFYGCGRLIHSIYMKWDRNPVVVTFAEKARPVFSIPFPAVTICPEIKVRKAEFDFSQAYQVYNDYENEDAYLPPDQLEKLEALLQVCDFAFGIDMDNGTYDDDVVQRLQQMAIKLNEIFVTCGWRGQTIDCGHLFKPTLTDSGICYTFNSLSADEMLRKEQLHSEYEYLTENRTATRWSMDDGYETGPRNSTYPRRTFGAGIRAGMYAILRVRLKDMDYLCSNSFQGFKVHLHPPNQYPRLYNQNFRVPLTQEVSVSIDPLVIETSANIRNYSPIRRQCYYNHERYLKYFKVYTKSNCEIECLANYTIKMCGCAHFVYPRTGGERICGLGMSSCCNRALSVLEELDLLQTKNVSVKLMNQCNCLPACNGVIYNTETSQARFDWRKLLEQINPSFNSDEIELSYLSIHFKVPRFIPIKRSELFGVSDFLANCGGVLGLFMGVSILSIVEIIYYCTLKPIMERNATSRELFTPKPIKSHLILPPEEYGVPIRQRKDITKW
ncbi:AGAP011610-PA-like protein [Anopheles sinensis]|uniref:AGAP011610-PA-like protein n=1 Tax=Anopheles sinensis TaxID=74873 RepID=A0A084WGS4_ANOSI|nr:AGAP011610-PA-like protein [Anopheles sinensis]